MISVINCSYWELVKNDNHTSREEPSILALYTTQSSMSSTLQGKCMTVATASNLGSCVRSYQPAHAHCSKPQNLHTRGKVSQMPQLTAFATTVENDLTV